MAAPPSSLADVEQLIHRMYNTRDPKEVNVIQDQLQVLQRSSDGWRLADVLLASEDTTSQFFGALTFTVKLNQDGPSLSDTDAQMILQTLISWLVKLTDRLESSLAVTKLVPTLVTYFVRVPNVWQRPLNHLLQAFASTAGSDRTGLDGYSPQQLVVLLNFATELAGELDRVGYSGPAQARLHGELQQEAGLVAQLVRSMLLDRTEDMRLQEAALNTYSAWALYSQSNFSGKHEALGTLRSLTDIVLPCLSPSETSEQAMGIFIDLLDSSTNFFTSQQLDAITNLIREHIAPQFDLTQAEDASHLTSETQLVVALGNAVVQDVVEDPNGVRSQVVLQLLSQIISLEGVPADQDELSIFTMDFWCTYCEHITDSVGSHSGPLESLLWLPHARAVMMQTCRALWRKMWLPPPEVIKGWKSDEIKDFQTFRSDVEELFNFMHVTLDLELTEDLVNICCTSLSQREWIAAEAALDLLAALADSVLEDQHGDGPLNVLFSSSLLPDVSDFHLSLPSQVRKTVIALIGAYGAFIKRNAQFIPAAVRFLFAALEQQTLAFAAARAIQDLCFTCRKHLTADLDGFLSQYNTTLALTHTDPYIKEKVIGGIAAIIQALDTDEARVAPLLVLLDTIDKDIRTARSISEGNEILVAKSQEAVPKAVESSAAMGLIALKCLGSMGKALETPEEIPIDIYDEDSSQTSSIFWMTGDGQVVQQRIMQCFSVLDLVGGDGEAIEAACAVLKTGLKEVQPGPFVLPPAVTSDFLASCTITTPQVESVLSTAAMLITHHSRPGTAKINDIVGAIFQQAVRFMIELRLPNQDPGVAQGCLDVITRLIPAYAVLLYESPALDTVLKFMLQAIEFPDLQPKHAALELSSKFIKAASRTSPMTNLSEDARGRAEALMARIGQDLTQVLIRQIAGMGQRSDLDHVNEPIKSLFTALPSQAQPWIEHALFSSAFPRVNASVGEAEKRRFMTQLAGLRGDSRTRDVIRNFYAACRGTVSKYN